MRLFLFFFAALISMNGWALADTPYLQLQPERGSYSLADHASILVTPIPDYVEGMEPDDFYPSIEELIASAAAGQFAPVTTRHIGIGLTPGTVTARLKVENPLDVPQDWIFAFNRPAQYFFSLYYIEDGTLPPSEPLLLFDVETDSWTDPDVQIHVPVAVPANSRGTLFASFQSLNGAAPMTLELPGSYRTKRQLQDMHFFAVSGLTMGLMLITASLMLTLRRFVGFYYGMAVLSGLVLVVVSEQYLAALFPWARDVTVSDSILTYAALCGPVFALLFQRQFFADVGGTGRLFGNFLLLMAGFSALTMVAVVEFEAISALVPVAALCGCTLLILINGCIAVRKGFVGRWPFFAGSFIYALGAVVKVLSFEFSWLLSGREASMILLYCISIEAAALAGTMFLQVRNIRQTRERASLENLHLTKAMSHAAHDIRQPLASLRMAMANAPDAPRHADMQKALGYLEDIVKRQLETESGVSGAKVSEREPVGGFAIQSVFDNLETMFRGEAEQRGLYLNIAETSAFAKVDAMVVMRILSNLLANAIRNTSEGGVELSCKVHPNFVVVEVIDSGCGLDQSALDDLEKPYVRQGDYEGFGLGLSIVKELCESQSLDLKMVSSHGDGTRFQLSLPRM